MPHLPFSDRLEAGRLLAAELAQRRNVNQGVVLALPRGGVPVGAAIAERLHLPLDVIVVRKLGVPWQPELAMGAIAGQTRILNYGLIEELGISAPEVESIIATEHAEMTRREKRFRGGEAAPDLHSRTAILVDDGLATGSTMLAAIRHARTLHPARILVGVPVGSKQACDLVRGEADELVCLAAPEMFGAVGQWYRDFEQVSDDEVAQLLDENRRRLKSHAQS